MITTVDIQTFPTIAASAASAMPCRHSFYAKRRNGAVLALAGRCVR